MIYSVIRETPKGYKSSNFWPSLSMLAYSLGGSMSGHYMRNLGSFVKVMVF